MPLRIGSLTGLVKTRDTAELPDDKLSVMVLEQMLSALDYLACNHVCTPRCQARQHHLFLGSARQQGIFRRQGVYLPARRFWYHNLWRASPHMTGSCHSRKRLYGVEGHTGRIHLGTFLFCHLVRTFSAIQVCILSAIRYVLFLLTERHISKRQKEYPDIIASPRYVPFLPAEKIRI